jgi:zinc transport system substrate-binding protein
MKPSDARLLHRSDLFFRTSESLEPFTARLVKSLPAEVAVVTLRDAPGLTLLARRTGANFEQHAHAKGHRGHSHGPEPEAVDGHVWLDPDNAKALVARIEQALSAKDPAHASRYRANAAAAAGKIDALAAELERELRSVAGKPFVVFHDAYQYLERRYALAGVGSISVSPDVPPSAKRLADLRKRIAAREAVCVFAEPEFEQRLVRNVIEGTSARMGTLDPEGARLDPGPDLYFKLMRKLAADLKECLSPAS